MERTNVADLMVVSGAGLVAATGYHQLTGNLQVAYLCGYGYHGALRWRAYDHDAVQGLGADTRGVRLVTGRDGCIYLGATINGRTGASIFARDPLDLNQSADDRTVTFDAYNTLFNVGSVKMSWCGRYDPTTGGLRRGQSLLTRLSSGRGNPITPDALAAHGDGTLYVAGSEFADLPDRESLRVAGQPVGSYEGGEPYLLVVALDFATLGVWAPLAREGFSAGSSGVTGVAVRGGRAAAVLIAAAADNRRLITSPDASQREPAGGPADGYFIAWPPAATFPTIPDDYLLFLPQAGNP